MNRGRRLPELAELVTDFWAAAYAAIGA